MATDHETALALAIPTIKQVQNSSSDFCNDEPRNQKGVDTIDPAPARSDSQPHLPEIYILLAFLDLSQQWAYGKNMLGNMHYLFTG